MSTGCWIQPWAALQYSFSIPISICIGINGICFVVTTVSLAKVQASSAALHANDFRHKRKAFITSVKISSVMGFSWLFGLLANIDGFQALWFIFIVLCTLQGVFIFCAFAARKLVKQVCQRNTVQPIEMAPSQ